MGGQEEGNDEAGTGRGCGGRWGEGRNRGREEGDDQASGTPSRALSGYFRPEIRSRPLSRGPSRIGQGSVIPHAVTEWSARGNGHIRRSPGPIEGRMAM